MFGKDDGKLESLVGPGSNLEGEFKVKGTLRVEGSIRGRVNADCVIVSERALFQGDITARRIIVGGKVEGNLRAQEVVEIKSKGKVLGEIFTNKFSVSEGGEVNGKIEMKKDESKVIEFDSKSQKA